MANKRDYYEVLGIGKGVSSQEIKRAYRRLAMQYHPDRNPENRKECEERFKEICEAYEVLSDQDKRQRYDRYGHEGVSSYFSPGGFNWEDFHHFGEFEDILGGFFEQFFGGGWGRRAQRARGRDIKIAYHLTLEEAAQGKEDSIVFQRRDHCSQCQGTGAKDDKGKKTCPACQGTGQRSFRRGFLYLSTTCDHCRGEGKIIMDPCTHCHGTGQMQREVRLKVKIPPGVQNGQILRIAGQGERAGVGALPGDLFLVVYTKEHPFFEREGDDLYCEMPISFVQAALGAELMVPTLYGEEKLHLPPGTQSHSVFRIRKQGMPRTSQPERRGDLYVRVVVKVPGKLTQEQKEILQQYARAGGDQVEEAKSGWFEKIKQSFKGAK